MTEPREIDRIVLVALDEDAPWGDLTGETLIPRRRRDRPARRPRARRVQRARVLEATFRLVDPRIAVEVLAADGHRFASGDVLARVQGPARGILRAERVALNLVQRMSGVATLTPATSTRSRAPAPASSTRARPRPACAASSGRPCATETAATTAARSPTRSWPRTTIWRCSPRAAPTSRPHCARTRERMPHTAHLEVEVGRIDQIAPVLAAGRPVMLDNSRSTSCARASSSSPDERSSRHPAA